MRRVSVTHGEAGRTSFSLRTWVPLLKMQKGPPPVPTGNGPSLTPRISCHQPLYRHRLPGLGARGCVPHEARGVAHEDHASLPAPPHAGAVFASSAWVRPLPPACGGTVETPIERSRDTPASRHQRSPPRSATAPRGRAASNGGARPRSSTATGTRASHSREGPSADDDVSEDLINELLAAIDLDKYRVLLVTPLTEVPVGVLSQGCLFNHASIYRLYVFTVRCATGS